MSDGLIIPNAASKNPHEKMVNQDGNSGVSPTLHRSASHTQLPQTSTAESKPVRTSSLNRSFSENVLPSTFGNASDKAITKQESKSGVRAHRSLRRLGSMKRRSHAPEPEPQFTISKFIIGADQSLEDVGYESPSNKGPASPPSRKARSVSGTISTFARKSWVSSSRSPSPSPSKRRLRKELEVNEKIGDVHEQGPENKPDSGANQAASQSTNKDSINTTRRRSSLLGKKSRRPLSSILSRTSNDFSMPSVPPIPKSFSTDKLPLSGHAPSTLENAPALPNSKSFERFQKSGSESPRKKDELWNVFRNLDGDYQKFQSRPGTTKTAIVRTALLPFLRAYADHPSISSLRPEDLDRRTVILNKWWTGLLEMLNGRRGESVSGNDRPAILEAVTALMVRPEWTLPLLTVTPRATKTPRASLKSRSTTSLGSTMTIASDFLAESVYHNVRNSFTQNLLAQMAYVVDKMSTRNVAASVVTFCGKATAYAFFYCEGVAEILVRLWSTSSDMLKRVLTETGVQKYGALESVSERISSMFPPSIRSLTFTSLRSLTKNLRNRPHLPIATTYIPWHGPWVSRWAGKDTDLFYIFAKFYTDLACRFLPDTPTPEELIVTPAWLLIQAQVLSILDSTMQRINSQSHNERNGALPVTFDDMLDKADATATVLPLPANGAARSMAENRLILLLRDCLSGSTMMTARAQSSFAQSSCLIIKAAARRISMYDHNACFTLCDFLEEALIILTRYIQTSKSTTTSIDWTFWLDVCKRMLESHNIMTQVRLCSFLYAMWPTLVSDESIKREMCLHWLLSEETFGSFFGHWCPMVRAFYMRLLIWRIARINGNHSDLDMAILEALAQRLRQSWGSFLFIQESAGQINAAAPSTPAPGRRLLIMRNDVQPAPAGMFLSFDGILSSSSTSKNNPYEKHSSLHQLSQDPSGQVAKSTGDRDTSTDRTKRRWSLFRTILPGSVSSARRGTDPAPRTHDVPEDPRSHQNHLPDSNPPVDGAAGTAPPYRSLSFKFSLEWVDREDGTLGREEKLQPPKLPILAHMYLDASEAQKTDSEPVKPGDIAGGPSKYIGKALAEWALLVSECTNFFERRRAEGVPSYQAVETPTLGVEPFRKL